MKKTILILCMVVIGSFLVLTNNSYAAREKRTHYQNRGGHYQKWHKPASHKQGPAWRHHLKRRHYRPAHGIRHKHYRWHLRPIYRHGTPDDSATRWCEKLTTITAAQKVILSLKTNSVHQPRYRIPGSQSPSG